MQAPAYVCPKCNEVVDTPQFPTGKKNEPKCAQNHPIGKVEPFGTTFVGGVIAGALYWIATWYLPSLSSSLTPVSGLLRVAALGCSIFWIGRGIVYSTRAQPTRSLAASSLGMGSGMLVGLLVLAAVFFAIYSKL